MIAGAVVLYPIKPFHQRAAVPSRFWTRWAVVVNDFHLAFANFVSAGASAVLGTSNPCSLRSQPVEDAISRCALYRPAQREIASSTG